MSALTDFLVSTFSGTLEVAGEEKLESLLQQLHDKNPQDYKAAVYGGHALVKALLPLTNSSKTKIDDAIIKALDESIKESATKNGIDLSEPVAVVEPVTPLSAA